MKKLLFILTFFLLLGCSKEEEVVLEPLFEIVQDAGQLGGPHSGLICLTAEGEFYNPYIQRTMTVSMKLENFPIGVDILATPYGYLLD
jgi:hypothetical protein